MLLQIVQRDRDGCRLVVGFVEQVGERDVDHWIETTLPIQPSLLAKSTALFSGRSALVIEVTVKVRSSDTGGFAQLRRKKTARSHHFSRIGTTLDRNLVYHAIPPIQEP